MVIFIADHSDMGQLRAPLETTSLSRDIQFFELLRYRFSDKNGAINSESLTVSGFDATMDHCTEGI